MVFLFSIFTTLTCAQDHLVKIGLGLCAHQDSSQRIWNAVLRWEPDLFVHLGDAVYADTRDSIQMRRTYEKASLNGPFKAVRERVPFLATWDDHDYGANDAGASYPMREASQSLFFDFWKEPASSERIGRPGVYGSRVILRRDLTLRRDRIVRVLLLDTRFFRSDWTPDTISSRRYQPDPSPSKTMLGSQQWAWLESELRKPADVRLITSSIQVVNDEHGWESWGNFPAERDRLLDLIRETQAEGVVFASGDRHFTELSSEKMAAYSVFYFTSSGLTQVASLGHTVPNSKRIGEAVNVQNFGGVTIDFESGALTFHAFDDSGQVAFQHTIPLVTLTFPDTK